MHAIKDFGIIVSVNLVYDQGLSASAAMSSYPQRAQWTASRAIDGDTNQSYKSNSCAITEAGRYTSIWWKVWLQRRFNIAYLEIYFRADSNFIFFLFSIHCLYQKKTSDQTNVLIGFF